MLGFLSVGMLLIIAMRWRYDPKQTISIDRWICATIDYLGEFRTAVANFKYPAFGAMYLRQAVGLGYDETTVWGRLRNMVRKSVVLVWWLHCSVVRNHSNTQHQLLVFNHQREEIISVLIVVQAPSFISWNKHLMFSQRLTECLSCVNVDMYAEWSNALKSETLPNLREIILKTYELGTSVVLPHVTATQSKRPLSAFAKV